MFLNGIDISEFNASVSSKLIQPSEIIIENEKLKLISTNISKRFTYKKIQIKILFEGDNRDIINNNISNFVSNFIDEVEIKFKDLSNYYLSYIVSSEVEETGLNEWLYLSLELKGIERGVEVKEVVNRTLSKVINIAGNIETPAIVEVTPSIDLIDLTINGLNEDSITLKNLKANKKLIVNGEDGTVLQDEVNKYGDTDMWGFPKLKPGVNIITVNKDSVDINIKYKPRFI